MASTPNLASDLNETQIITLHTARGLTLYQFVADGLITVDWNRQLREVSTCDITVPTDADFNQLPDIVPWLHWCSVWGADTGTLRWKGPVQKVTGNRYTMTLNCKDHAAFLARTRNPLSKSWDGVDPAIPAGELWSDMITQQSIFSTPIIRPDAHGRRFDYSVVGDAQMLDQTISDLVQQGLNWTIVCDVPLLGPYGYQTVASLGEQDFLGDQGINIMRDGSNSYNDILVRGPDSLARARVVMAGLNLQTIVNVNNMFGVSNVDKASTQYAIYAAAIRTAIDLPEDVVLSPEAPVSIEQLIPSARFVVEAYGVRQLVQLQKVAVKLSSGTTTVSVGMESVVNPDDLPELIDPSKQTNTVPVGSVTTSQASVA